MNKPQFLTRRVFFIDNELYQDYKEYALEVLEDESNSKEEMDLIISTLAFDFRFSYLRDEVYSILTTYSDIEVDIYSCTLPSEVEDHAKRLRNWEPEPYEIGGESITLDDFSAISNLEPELDGMEVGIEDYVLHMDNPLEVVPLNDMVSIDLNYRLGKEDGIYKEFPRWFIDKFNSFYRNPSEDELKKLGYDGTFKYRNTLELYVNGKGYFMYENEAWYALAFFPSFSGDTLLVACESKDRKAIFQIVDMDHFTSVPSFDFIKVTK